MLRIIIFAWITLFLVSGLNVLKSENNSQSEEAEVKNSEFAICLKTDQAIYSPDQPISMKLCLSNYTGKEIVLGFRNAQRYDFVIENDTGDELWRWSNGKMFAQMLGEETVGPGQELIYTERCESHLDPGTYKLSAFLKATDRPFSASLTIVIE